MERNGFTLLEVMISASLIVIVSLLGFVALQSSARMMNINQTTALLQSDVRNLMLVLTREIEPAVKPVALGLSLPPGVEGLRVLEDNSGVVYQVPADNSFTQFSSPIAIQFETEDTPLAIPNFEFGNAILDPGEDRNHDGVLNRRVLRMQDGETRVLGGANNIADAHFELLENNQILRVRVVATRRIDNVNSHLARFELQSDIYLMN